MRPSLLFCLLLTSCGTSFSRQWAEEAANPTLKQKSGIEGLWEGTWLSEGTGHKGKLRCIVGPALNLDGDHLFTYRATWQGILSGTFRAKHRVQPDGANHKFKGEHKLPSWAGGTYKYQGSAQSGHFEATYRCEKDHGSFSMKRP